MSTYRYQVHDLMDVEVSLSSAWHHLNVDVSLSSAWHRSNVDVLLSNASEDFYLFCRVWSISLIHERFSLSANLVLAVESDTWSRDVLE